MVYTKIKNLMPFNVSRKKINQLSLLFETLSLQNVLFREILLKSRYLITGRYQAKGNRKPFEITTV